MEKRNNKNINFKELDSFIQNCLDKYFYVEPWKKLYDRTGRFHHDIISDKSTIPDLIIYNKSFNKSDCFYESNFNSYVKFPRMRFILRPKYKKEYNPTVTYGNEENAVLYYYKSKNIKDFKDKLNENLNINLINNSPKVERIEKQNKKTKTFFKENKMDDDEEEEEEDPEWANDNVEDFNKIKIEFKAIPETVENQINKNIKLNNSSNNSQINQQKEDKNIIDIDKFFMDENLEQKQVQSAETVNFNNDNFNDFIGNVFNNNNIINKSKENLKNFSDNNDNLMKRENNLNINKTNNSNEYFDIFDTENKYKNIYVEDENTYNNDNNSNNNNESKDEDIDYFDIPNKKEGKDKTPQKNNNLNSPNNYLNNNYLINLNNQNLINRRFMNNKYVNNINNSNRHNLINPLPYNNINLLGMNMPNYSNYSNFNPNNMYLANNVQYIENNKKMYINNLNNTIYTYNLQNQLLNNINKNYTINQNNVCHNIIPINSNNYSIPTSYISLNNNLNHIPFNYNCGNSNNVNRNFINNINNNVNMYSLRQNNNNNNINYYPKKNEQKINYICNLNRNEEIFEKMNPLEYSENPTNLVIIKNMNKKKWIVFEKDKGNYIHNFNTKELYEYLEENNTEESFKNITINDSETDYYFPTKEIYVNLKRFYSKN